MEKLSSNLPISGIINNTGYISNSDDSNHIIVVVMTAIIVIVMPINALLVMTVDSNSDD